MGRPLPEQDASVANKDGACALYHEPIPRRSRTLFADAEVAEDDVEQILHIDAAGDAAERPGGEAKVLGGELGKCRRVVAPERRHAFLERGAMARAGDQ